MVGSSGSGKTRLARRIADLIGAPHVELDSIYHLAGWQALDAAEFLRWAWTQFGSYQERYGTAMRSPELSHLDFVRLTSHAAADAWLREVASPRRPG